MASTSVERKPANGVPTSFLVGQILVLGLGYFFYTVNRIAFPAGLADIGKTFHFSVLQASTLGTVFLLGQAIIDIPAGYLADRMNRRALLSFGVFGIGLTTALFTLLTFNFVTALCWRLLFGMCEGVFNITLFAIVGAILPKRRGFLNNLMGIFYAGGSLVGPIGLAMLISGMGQWRTPLRIYSAVTMLWAIIGFFAIRVSEKDFPALAEQRRRISLGEGFFGALGRLFKNRKFWGALSIFALNTISLWGFAGVGAYILTHFRGMSTLFAATILGTSYGLGTSVDPFLGIWSDKVGRKIVIVLMGLIDAVCLYFLFCLGITAPWFLILMGFGFGAGCNAIYYLGYTVVQDAVDVDQIGLATGCTGAIGYFLGALAGTCLGAIATALGHVTAVYVVLILPQVLLVLAAAKFLTWKNKAAEAAA